MHMKLEKKELIVGVEKGLAEFFRLQVVIFFPHRVGVCL